MTGLSKLESLNNFTIYPNPALEEITINGLGDVKEFQVSIYDSNGKLMLDKSILNNQSINLNGVLFSQGIYVVKIRSGNQVSTKKLMLY
jgi:flagellar basal body P-ring protein FlgI